MMSTSQFIPGTQPRLLGCKVYPDHIRHQTSWLLHVRLFCTACCWRFAPFFILAIALMCAVCPRAGEPFLIEPMTNHFEFTGLSLAIPDSERESFLGVQNTREISMGAEFDSIVSVSVTVNIQGSGSGAFNGDFYAYLTKGDNIAILLNRPGRSAENLAGYGDNGLNIRFDDLAPNGDIHMYRLTLSGSHYTPLDFGQPLTGSWAPDGRYVHPGLALDTDSRTRALSVFEGTDPNGEWTLFVADLEPGGQGVLISWGLDIVAVPEPRGVVLMVLGLMLIGLLGRKKHH